MIIKQIHSSIYKVDDLLPLNFLSRVQDEFNPLYNNWAWKQESDLIENASSYPRRLGLSKVSGDSLGWSLSLIDLSTYLKIF